MLINSKCDSYGVIELNSNFYSAIETDQTLTIQINRYYGSLGKVSIYYEILDNNLSSDDYYYQSNYDITNIKIDHFNNPLSKMEYSKGIIVFNPGESMKTINLNIYSDNFINENINLFYINLYNPQGGCYLGKISKAFIEIFEDIITYVDTNSLTASVINLSSDNYDEYNIYLNNNVHLQINSYSQNNVPKITNNDIFLFKILNVEKNFLIEEINKLSYLNSNIYEIIIPYTSTKNPPGFVGQKSVILYNCIKYFKMIFYETTGFVGEPFFIRNIKEISIDQYCNYIISNFFNI